MTTIQEWTRGEYVISTDPQRLDADVIQGFLARSYWAQHRSRERMARAIEHSIPFGLYQGRKQIGFARVVTDYATMAWLADVFVDETYRGHGLGVWLVDTATNLPELLEVRRFIPSTRDAHELYRKMGFTEPIPNRLMERFNADSDRL